MKVFLAFLAITLLLSCEPNKRLKFSLKNATDIAIKDIVVGLPDTTLHYSKLNAKSSTGWVNTKSAYSYGYLKFKDLHNKEYIVQPEDYVGETLYKNGYMTFIIESLDSVKRRVQLNFSRESNQNTQQNKEVHLAMACVPTDHSL